MTPHPSAAPPSTVVLATDLAPRCDRAAARATRLAARHATAAIAVAAIDPAPRRARELMRPAEPAWYRPASPVDAAERQLRQQLAGDVPWQLQVAERDADAHLHAALDGLGPEVLVVGGPVREGVLGPTVLGSTVDGLLRRPTMALLLVRDWVDADYRRVLVASDFSEPSARALRRARGLFPGARFTLLHGFTLPMLGLRDCNRGTVVAEGRERLHGEGARFLADLGADGEGIELVIEYGDPARLVQQHVETFGSDLVVAGTHGRGGMHELVVGSVARRLVTGARSDVLVVRDDGGPVRPDDAR